MIPALACGTVADGEHPSRDGAIARGVLRDDSGWAGTGWPTLGEQPQPSGRAVRLTTIPYHLWANRGPSVMRTFVPVWRGSTPCDL